MPVVVALNDSKQIVWAAAGKFKEFKLRQFKPEQFKPK
jgi:hypothetical protein